MRKRWIYRIFIVLSIIFIILAFNLALVMVNNGRPLKKDTLVYTIDETEEVTDIGNNNVLETSYEETEYEEPSLYEKSEGSNHEQLENTEGYDSILSQIRLLSESVFSGLSSTNVNLENIVIFGVKNNNILGLDESFLKRFPSFFIENSLTIIDMFDNRYIVFAYNYPENVNKELIVVDFSDATIYFGLEDMYFAGDLVSIKGSSENSEFRKIEDYNVLFVKG